MIRGRGEDEWQKVDEGQASVEHHVPMIVDIQVPVAKMHVFIIMNVLMFKKLGSDCA